MFPPEDSVDSNWEDSERKRYLFNMYNRRARALVIENGTVHNYNTAAVRPVAGSLVNSEVEMFIGVVEDNIDASLAAQILRVATDGNPRVSIGVNSASVEYGNYGLAITVVGRVRGGSSANVTPNLGYNFISMLEFSSAGTPPGALFEASNLNANVFA